MPKLLLPLAAVLAVGAATAGGATYLLTRDEAVEEVPPSAVQATATPLSCLRVPTPPRRPSRVKTARRDRARRDLRETAPSAGVPR